MLPKMRGFANAGSFVTFCPSIQTMKVRGELTKGPSSILCAAITESLVRIAKTQKN